MFCKIIDLAVNIVNKAITPNTTLPVLNNILLRAEGGKLHFASTNLEVAIQFFIPADVKSEGSITVPAKLLSSYIALLTDETVEIEVVSGDVVQIKSATSQTKIKGINASEFPVIPKVEKENVTSVSSSKLEEAINQTVFAASTNTSRPVLSGVLFDFKKDLLKLVATDSYRLAEKTIYFDDKNSVDIECIVPARTVMELGKLLAKVSNDNVEVSVSKSQILFIAGNIRLISRLIEGKFPPYDKVIPKETKTKLEISVSDLVNVTRRVNLFARENNNSIKFSVTNDGKLIISTDETRVGEEKAEIDVKISGANNQIAINAQYLLDVLNYINSDVVAVEIEDKLSPIVIKSIGGKDYVYIIMPLKV